MDSAARDGDATANGAPGTDQRSSPPYRRRREDEPVQRATVLVASAAAETRDCVARLLRHHGWAVTVVPNGAAALGAAHADPPGVMLSDVALPELDGYQLLAALRADARTASVPFILIADQGGEDARREAVWAGADDCLLKPFGTPELLTRIEAQLRRARERAAEQHRADEQRHVLDAIESERARFREVFQQAPAAIAVLRGPDHIYEIANPAYLSLVGDRTVLGKPLREAIPELVGQGVIDIVDRVYETGLPHSASEFRTMFDADNDGAVEEHYVNFVCQPIHGPDNRVTALFLHAVEVTDLVRARREADRVRLDAEEANRAKSAFLAAMSHELRTPLNAIAGHAELLDMGIHGPVTPRQHEALGRIRRSEAHLLSLINDILNFAKIEAGHIEYDTSEVNVPDLVDEVLTMLQPMLDAHRLRSEVRVSGDAVARGDREKIKQILLNLLSNAIKFTEEGGRIAIETPRRDIGPTPPNVVLLRISDTGLGIPRDRQEVVFDPFVQVHRRLTNNTEGTGLGLAISRDLARGMEGDLRVRSTEGQGSAFTLSLRSATPAEHA